MWTQSHTSIARLLILSTCISILSSPYVQPKYALAESITPLTQQDFQNSEIEGFNDQGQALKFQIRKVEIDPKDPQHEVHLYTVFFQNNQHHWQNLCNADAQYPAKAIALPGSWDNSGTYRPRENQVTFSCLNGAIAKCVQFGYKPWKTVNGRSLEDYHQACVRMVRADYCGDGTAHTKDGTIINLYDRLNIQKRDAVAGMSFEAAWGIDGAQSIHHTRYPEDLAYVQRVCPNRLAANQATSGSKSFPPALLFNDSALITPQRD